jgi:hypothetical protein
LEVNKIITITISMSHGMFLGETSMFHPFFVCFESTYNLDRLIIWIGHISLMLK